MEFWLWDQAGLTRYGMAISNKPALYLSRNLPSPSPNREEMNAGSRSTKHQYTLSAGSCDLPMKAMFCLSDLLAKPPIKPFHPKAVPVIKHPNRLRELSCRAQQYYGLLLPQVLESAAAQETRGKKCIFKSSKRDQKKSIRQKPVAYHPSAMDGRCPQEADDKPLVKSRSIRSLQGPNHWLR